ncbi:MAG: hypothetical protein ACYCZR_03075 [Burkholderiales bacterium]
MGSLRAKINHAPERVNGVRLGEPTIVREDGSSPEPGDDIRDLFWQWNDSRIPDGVVGDTGVITVAVDADDGRDGKARTLAFDAGVEPA